MGRNSCAGVQPDRLDRRTVLTGLASGLVVGVAGCSSSDESRENHPDGSTPDQATQTATPEGRNDTETTDTDTETPAQQYTVTFEHPDEVLADDPFGMTISGLPANTTVEVRQGKRGRVGTTTATVETDENGEIDLTDATVVGGDVPPDLDVPLTVALIQFRSDASITSRRQTVRYGVSFEGSTLGSTELTREFPPIGPDEQAGGDLVGGLFEPIGRERGPGVVVLHGSGGDPSYARAGQLALHGYTTLALQYFGGPGLPDELVEVPLEYVETAIEWLRDHEATVGEQVGLAGVSKGGELALLAGSEFDTVGSVVSVAGSGLVWGGVSQSRTPPGSSWSLDEAPVDHVPITPDGWDEPIIEGYQNSLAQASEETIEAATIPVENIDGPVMLVSGGDDKLWNAERYQSIAADRLSEHDHPNFDHLVYEDAGHGILPPYYSVQGSLDSQFGTLGGTLTGNAYASHDYWPHVLETLSGLER